MLPVSLCSRPQLIRIDDGREPGKDLLLVIDRDFVRVRHEVELADSGVVGFRVLLSEKLDAPASTSPRGKEHSLVGVWTCVLADYTASELLD